MKKSSKKILGYILSISIAATAVFPIQGIAAGQQKDASAQTRQKESSEEQTVHRKRASEDAITDEETLRTEEAQIPEQVVTAPEEEQTDRNTLRMDEAADTFLLPQNTEGELIAAAGKFDVVQPVIEKFEFLENGQTLTKDDTLHFKVWAYDSDSGIDYIEITLIGKYGYTISCSKDDNQDNLYTGTCSCEYLAGNNHYISGIKVRDNVGNTNTSWKVQENEQYLYSFTLEGNFEDKEQDDHITLANFQMQTNPSNEDGKLQIGDTVTYTADMTCKDETVQHIDMSIYSYANSSWAYNSFTGNYDSASQTLTGTYTVTDKTYPSEWYLSTIYIYTESGKSYYFYPESIEPNKDLTFTVVQDNFDIEKPIIESITIDKNGQWVYAGDTINITVKVTEDNPSEYAYAYFTPQVSDVDADADVPSGTRTAVLLSFNTDTREYTGSITITDKTYPCEWDLTHLEIHDEIGHYTYLSDFEPDYYYTSPWYYKVKSGTTYRIDPKNVTFRFYGYARQEDGTVLSNSLIDETTVETGRRASLRELKLSFPQPIEGVSAEWNYMYAYGKLMAVNEDTEFLIDNGWSYNDTITCDFYASYDKGCANVSLSYLSKSDGIKSVNLPQFVDKETTFQEVLNILELPEDAQTEDFEGFKLAHINDYHNENTPVDELASIYVTASYKNCQVAWNTRYVDKDGKECSKTINKKYSEGTKISDALADLEAPEGTNSSEFEMWILPEGSEEETLSETMTSLDAVAIYKGKTTADTVYSYRGEDGKITSDNKMMLISGENLSDSSIKGEASEAFKSAKHLAGLQLSEWTDTVKINQPRYKKIQFQALYYNCVVTLNYPDGSCQYSVVDRNSQFKLPAENEKYQDIIWAGYTKGETVTIKEDMEFTVADSKLKDGTSEEITGERLSEEEVAKILTEIENAAPGTTITIDMKKATIIPKEVLEAIKGTEINISLEMEGYSWNISGQNVSASKLQDIDLEVKTNTNAIPSSLVQSIAGDQPATQLSLTHNGDFGFRADLTLNLGSEHSGATGNLYYYDSSGKLIFVNSGQISPDGTTSLSFSHASDYVIVIEKKSDQEKAPSQNDDNSTLNTRKNNDNFTASADHAENDNSTLNIKKNNDNFTTSAGNDENNSANGGKIKSPKTGE